MKSLLAAIMMFTRIPLWRMVKIEKAYYSNVVLYWPLVGFITGTATWVTLHLLSGMMPVRAAVILAISARLLLTGALHEDGLADVFDGFGGGHDRASILRIMKDSHIGSYGTIGLMMYFLLYASLLSSCPASFGLIAGADVLSKLGTALMINSLPYARPESESKNKLLYRKFSFRAFLAVAAACFMALWYLETPFIAMLPALAVTGGLREYFKYKIGGYTGDCCGATVLLAELAFYLGAVLFYF